MENQLTDVQLFRLEPGGLFPDSVWGEGADASKMYLNLKIQIFRKGIHQNELARHLGMDETLLSKIIRGYRQPSELQRKRLAEYLGASEQWLFDHYEATGSRPDVPRKDLRDESGDGRD